MLLRANGGEIATLDSTREALVSRSRQIYPRLDPSQAQAAPSSRPRREPAASTSDIEGQPTHVLPSSHGSAPYRLGEGLIGFVAQKGVPVILNADQYREQFRGARDLEGQWYLAVPVFRPGDLSSLRGDHGVLGVIVLYNRDPHWAFTSRDAELLALHADRLARRMMDEELRRSMQIEIKRIQVEVGLTFIHVTHDQEEAMTMADTIAVMNAGVIEQMGAPDELYENPRTTFVANFLGQSNLIEGTIASQGAEMTTVDMHGITVSVLRGRAHTESGQGWVGIRPEKVLIGDVGEALDAPGNTIPGGVVTDVSFVGVSTQYLVKMPWGQELQVFEQNTGRRRLFRVGDQVELSWRPEYAFLLDHEQDASAGAQLDDE